MTALPDIQRLVPRLRGLPAGALVCVFLVSSAFAQSSNYPLEPPDRSSPRATLKTFLDSSDAAASYFAQEYRPARSRQTFRRLLDLLQTPVECLDLSDVPPAARGKTARSAALALYETLNRIELPPLDQVPGAERYSGATGTNVLRWVIPHTEIALSRVATGPHAGEFLFTADTVDRIDDFYNRVRDLPYARAVPVQGLYERRATGGGWLIPLSWIEAMPVWLRSPLGGQAIWKWIALALLLGGFVVLFRLGHRLTHGKDERPFRRALRGLLHPLLLLGMTPVAAHLALVQIALVNEVGSAVELLAVAIMYLAGAWLSWRAAPVLAEAIIASPNIAPESIDAHLIRICLRLIGFIGAAALLAVGADRLGVPVYGIIAGLGVGGLAIALAAQPTIENLIGSLNLFADKPIRVGNFCQYGQNSGTVETIGIRSTRIRGTDRTLTTIPNAVLSKMPIVNFTQRDQLLLQATIGVRVETTGEQLRYLLARLREMLIAHPRIRAESARARLTGLGASSLVIEVFAYAATADWQEFLAIQEDVFLRIKDIVQQSGTALALPSQTIYLGRDSSPDSAKKEAAEAQVRQWRAEGVLPFPNLSPDQIARLQGTLAYPPPGSAGAHHEATPEKLAPATTKPVTLTK